MCFQVDIEELQSDQKPPGKKKAKRTKADEEGVVRSAAEKKKLYVD